MQMYSYEKVIYVELHIQFTGQFMQLYMYNLGTGQVKPIHTDFLQMSFIRKCSTNVDFRQVNKECQPRYNIQGIYAIQMQNYKAELGIQFPSNKKTWVTHNHYTQCYSTAIVTVFFCMFRCALVNTNTLILHQYSITCDWEGMT